MPTTPNQLLYAGPAKALLQYQSNLYPLQADGVNAPLKLEVQQKRTKRATGNYGYFLSALDDITAKITLTPFDSWLSLPCMFPGFLGVDTSAIANGTAAALGISTRPHDYAAGVANGNQYIKIWTPDGRLYKMIRAAILKPPVLNLGVNMPFYGPIEIMAVADPTVANLSTSACIFDAAPVSGPNDTGAVAVAEPDPLYPLDVTTNFINGHWTGAWGDVAGFGGDGAAFMDTEDGWQVMVEAQYSPLTVQKRTYHYKLDSVEVSCKGRLTGPSHSALVTQATAFNAGAIITKSTTGAGAGAKDLVLTGPNSHTITMKNAQPMLENSGFEFGGTKLNTGEVVFVSKVEMTSGVPTATLIFSA